MLGSSFGSASIIAQTSTFTGRVFAEDKPLAGVTVYIPSLNKGDVTNEEGIFVIKALPVGTHQIKISFLGFKNVFDTISTEPGKVLKKEYELEEDFLNLDAMVVSGTRYELDRANAPVVVNVLSNKLLAATQSISISEGLSFQPGVRIEANCQNCGFTQVRMNGLSGNYSQILINSRPIFSALNSVYGLEQIPTNIVEQVEVTRSGGSALYGSNAIAGTINIITKEPVTNNWEIHSNTALIAGKTVDQTLSFNGSIVDESLKTGVTFYAMNRDRGSYDANGDGFTELVQLKNNVFGSKFFIKPSNYGKIMGDFSLLKEYRRGGDQLDLAPHFTDITEELIHDTFFGSLNYDQRTPDNKNKISVYASLQRTLRDSFYGGLGGGRTPQDSALAINAYGNTDDLAVVVGVQYNRYFDSRDVFTFGIENQYYNTTDEIQGYRRIIDQQVNTLGLFVQYEWKPWDKLTTLLGLRYDLNNVDGDYKVGTINNSVDINLGVLSPRFTLLYTINEYLRFRGGYARGFRSPQAFNEDLHISSVGGEPLFVILSKELDKETSNAYTASINYTRNRGVTQTTFLLEGFFTQLQDPFSQVSTGRVLSNGSILEEVRNGEGATVSGINFELGYSPSSSFFFQIGGTLQQTSYDNPQVLFEPEEQPVLGESTVTVKGFLRNPNMYGYFATFYNISKSLQLDVSGTYTGSMVVPRVVSETGFLRLIDSNPFIDVNLKLNYHIDIFEDFSMTMSGGLKNMFNSFQDEFDVGPTRDSDFVFGPLAPRSVFISLKIGDLH